MLTRNEAYWLCEHLFPDERNLSEKDEVKLSDLLERFVHLIREKKLSIKSPMVEDVRGYIAYCLADEGSFADVESYNAAQVEACKWLIN